MSLSADKYEALLAALTQGKHTKVDLCVRLKATTQDVSFGLSALREGGTPIQSEPIIRPRVFNQRGRHQRRYWVAS